MAYLELPVNSDFPSYEFQTELEQIVYTFYIQYNARSNKWVMEIRDTLDNPILSGIPVVSNVLLTNRFQVSGKPPGDIFVFDSSGSNADPTFDEFGTRFKLIYRESTT